MKGLSALLKIYSSEGIVIKNKWSVNKLTVNKVLVLLGIILSTALYISNIAFAAPTRFDYTGSMQTFTVPRTSAYKLEVWGAQGGSETGVNSSYVGGYGGYAYGTKTFNVGDVIYIFVGGRGQSTSHGNDGGFGTTYQGGYGGGGNGAGSGGAGGGGSTDIRLNSGSGTWSNSTGLSSRIIVAGGGGGGAATTFTGGEGGETTYLNGSSAQGENGTAQTISSGYWADDGCGGSYWVDTSTTTDEGGGGGGYVGGKAVHGDNANESYGGSSYLGGVSNGGMTSKINTGNGYAIITDLNVSPTVSITSPVSGQVYSAVSGNNIITISGKVWDPEDDSVTVSASINGKTKSQVINPTPTSQPGADNYTLTWDVASDNLAEGTYSNIIVTADEGAGASSTAALASVIVDKTVPIVSAPVITNTQNSSISVQAGATDSSTPIKFLFNLDGTDVGSWQSSNTYTYTGLTQYSQHTMKFKAKDNAGNISVYSSSVNATAANSFIHIDTTQSDFQAGTSNNTTATSGGDVVLATSTTGLYILPVTVNNSTNPSILTNYQVSVTLNTAALVTAGKMRSDCGDLRVYDSDGTTALSYYIDSGTANTTSTKVWVKVPTISANSTKTIYLTYGNASLTSTSDPNATFEAYGDFGDLDTYVINSYYPTSNNVTSGTNSVGGWGDYYYGLLQIPSALFPSYVTTSNVNSVSLNMNRYAGNPSGSTQTETTTVSRVTSNWSPSTVTWNTKPTTSGTISSETQTINSPGNGVWSAVAPSGWMNFNLTTWFTGWKGGTYTNYGLMMTPSNTAGVWLYYNTVNTSTPWYVAVTYNTNQQLIIENIPSTLTKWRTRKTASVVPIISLGTEQGTYYSSANYVSPTFDVSAVGIGGLSSISWNAVTPANTTVLVETNLSTNGGTTWAGWQTAASGSAIPGISTGINLASGRLKYRITLSTTDTTVTPQFNDIALYITAKTSQNPVVSLSTPSTNQTFYTSGGIISITGKVSDPDGDNVTLSASINGKTKSVIVNSAPTSPPVSDNFTLTWDVAGDNIAVSTYNNITVSANDGLGGMASAVLGVNLTVSSLPPAGSITAAPGALFDEFNDNNAHDMRIMFKGAADEAHIKEYRVIATRTAIAGGIDANTASGYDNTKYTTEPLKGKLRLHMFNLPQTFKDIEGNAISNGTQYRIFILAAAKTGYSSTLTSLGDITLNSAGILTVLPSPTVMDIANNNNASDMKVTFKRPASELDVQEYRIFVRSTSASAFNLAAANACTNFKKVLVTDGTKYGLTVTLGSTMLDTTGTGNPIVNGQTYEIYVLAVMGKSGMTNILSTPSKPIKLLATVPAVSPVRGLSAAKVGTGHDSSNISVTFAEPTAITNISEYRVFIVPAAGTLDVLTAAGINNSVNTRYQAVAVTAKSTVHTLTLNSGMKAFDGTNLAAGDYKVYVLAVGSGNYAGRLSGVSNKVTLD